MNKNLKIIKIICDERNIRNEYVEASNVIRLFPDSFDNATLSKADLWEYVFKLKNPRLDTRHTYIENLNVQTDIYVTNE